ncbi:MAG: hypothetical protein SFX18_17790 [Pirellulales bacterium]|nr:hypothetical protein [Pirellulales bacterium]
MPLHAVPTRYRVRMIVALCRALLCAPLLTLALTASPAAELRPLDLSQARAHGIRELRGQHIVLLTDVPSLPVVDELPAVFDAFVPQLCEYFAVPAERVRNWQIRVFLMENRQLFADCGLLPDNLPQFENGYAINGEAYFVQQTSDYYRRHLLLHEGTHLFQFDIARINSPPWYTEGVAELLATHLWEDDQLRGKYFPRDARELSKWGRIEMVQEELARDRGLSWAELQNFQSRDFGRNSSYGWAWHVAAVLDNHPRYQRLFRKFHTAAQNRDFAATWKSAFEKWEPQLAADMQIFTRDAVYQYDWQRTAVEFKPGRSFPAGKRRATVTVRADAGWQNSGVILEQGQSYQINAEGEFILRTVEPKWTARANGITIQYHHGRPLGELQGAIWNDSARQPASEAVGAHPLTFLTPMSIGERATLIAPRGGTLFFKLNDSAAELADNSGGVQVEIRRETPAP